MLAGILAEDAAKIILNFFSPIQEFYAILTETFSHLIAAEPKALALGM